MSIIRISTPKAILLDIEGTTTDLSYVSKVLFPFIKSHLKQFLMETWGRPEVLDTVDRLRAYVDDERAKEIKLPPIAPEDEYPEAIIKSVVANVLIQMDEKRTNPELKQLQILVWVWGYEKSHLKGHVFDDVPRALHQWKNTYGIRIFVYSSGMTVAQKLLFSCSNHGNILPLIEDFFDNVIGPKTDEESFHKVSQEIGVHESDILFLSDNPVEVQAALNAGCKSIIVVRPRNRPLSEADKKRYFKVHSFEDIQFKYNY